MNDLHKAYIYIWKNEKNWLIFSILNNIIRGIFPALTVWITERLINSITLLIQEKAGNYLIPLFWLCIQFMLMVLTSLTQKGRNIWIGSLRKN